MRNLFYVMLCFDSAYRYPSLENGILGTGVWTVALQICGVSFSSWRSSSCVTFASFFKLHLAVGVFYSIVTLFPVVYLSFSLVFGNLFFTDLRASNQYGRHSFVAKCCSLSFSARTNSIQSSCLGGLQKPGMPAIHQLSRRLKWVDFSSLHSCSAV